MKIATSATLTFSAYNSARHNFTEQATVDFSSDGTHLSLIYQTNTCESEQLFNLSDITIGNPLAITIINNFPHGSRLLLQGNGADLIAKIVKTLKFVVD